MMTAFVCGYVTKIRTDCRVLAALRQTESEQVLHLTNSYRVLFIASSAKVSVLPCC
jgi:hypothetical protein